MLDTGCGLWFDLIEGGAQAIHVATLAALAHENLLISREIELLIVT